MLKAVNVNVNEDTIPTRGYQRQFLKDNFELFKVLWNPINHAAEDLDPFDIRNLVNKLTLTNTLYMPYEDYKSNLMFDLRGLLVQYGAKSFTNPSPIRRINEFGKEEKYLTVKFTP
jgi:hypothetical protein